MKTENVSNETVEKLEAFLKLEVENTVNEIGELSKHVNTANNQLRNSGLSISDLGNKISKAEGRLQALQDVKANMRYFLHQEGKL